MALRRFHSFLTHCKFVRHITLGIRREGKNRWECRVPLIPAHVQQLLLEIPSSQIIVQPSYKRVYPDEIFEKAGAIVQDDLGSCDVILGVKEVAIKELLPNKTYMFFSHTHKGQLHNMPMLEHITKNRISLADYELLVNDHGKRTVMFGAFAGFAGAINALHGLGDRLLYAGYKTPFLNIGLAHHYPNLESAKTAISLMSKEIRDHGLSRKLGPIIFCVTGHGNVSTGVVDILKLLPVEFVTPETLPKLCQETFDTRKIYCVQVTPKDYLKYEGEFQLANYYKDPAKYESIFHEKIAPFITLLFNGIYWDARFPRLLTVSQINKLASAKNLRLLSIADISCDLNGPIEFVTKTTLIERPFFIYDPISGDKNYVDSEANGIQVMSIDNLPTQLPKDASEYFSKALYPYISDMLKNGTPGPDLHRAYITDKGKLLPKHEHLASLFSKTTVMDAKGQGVLLLGSGLVSGPFIAARIYDRHDPSNHLSMLAGNGNFSAYENEKNIQLKKFDVENTEALEALVRDADIVVSLLPAALHPVIAEVCIKYKKHMVTASYESPAIKALDEKAKKAGITILNEIGLDPGIDHLAAMSVIDSVKETGGKVREFVSWCGGLPAPEHSNNPFGYKFSWSPRGVLLATLNSAKYRKDHVNVEIEGNKLMSSAMPVDMYPGFAFEGIPNRDSLKYESQYGLEEMKTMFRGTLRYKGYASLMRGCQALGLFDTSPEKMKTVSHCSTWAETMKVILQSDTPFFENVLSEKLGNAQEAEKLYEALQWLGALSLYQPFDKKASSLLDAFCSLLQEKLAYCSNERDLVFLSHSFVTENAQGNREYITSTLVSFGDPKGDSAMAKTVGLPTAIATDLILKGAIQEKGVIVPTSPLIYKPLLSELEKQGIAFVEKKSSFASRVFVP